MEVTDRLGTEARRVAWLRSGRRCGLLEPLGPPGSSGSEPRPPPCRGSSTEIIPRRRATRFRKVKIGKVEGSFLRRFVMCATKHWQLECSEEEAALEWIREEVTSYCRAEGRIPLRIVVSRGVAALLDSLIKRRDENLGFIGTTRRSTSSSLLRGDTILFQGIPIVAELDEKDVVHVD